MSVTDICRLCSLKNNLVWVFDARFENIDSMKNMILVTTGVEVCTTDVVSQNICEKCCHIIIKMFQFRKKSLKNDLELKEKLKALEAEKDAVALPTEVQIKQEKMDVENEDYIPIHPTVKELFKLHPHIKLPHVCLNADLKPFVVMQMDKVENYYKERKLNFEEHCRLALRRRTTARKKTLASPTSSCPFNGQIIRDDVEDTENGVLRPIKIKIIPKVPTNEKPTENAKDVLRINEAEQQEAEETPPDPKKRKYSDPQESSTKENETPVEVEIQHPPNLDGSKSLSYVTNESVPLHICSICDAVHYNTKDLKRHRHKHLRCQFCKTMFQSLESKNEHLESNCLVKKAMNNITCIELPKIETDVDIVRKFPDAFATDFPSTIDIQNPGCELPSGSRLESVETPQKPIKHVAMEDPIEVIEILSDDDDDVPIVNTSNKNPPPTNITKLIPVIKPDVKIIDNPILDNIGPNLNEALTLKHLLINSKPLMSVEKETQTETPDQYSVEMNQCGQSATLSNLKQHLHVFRVPVVIKRGPFNVSFNHKEEPKLKKLQLWGDLTPLDIKENITSAAAPCAIAVPPESDSSTRTMVEDENVNTLISQEDTTKSSYENCNNISDADAVTIQPTFTEPANSTHKHITILGNSVLSAFMTGKKSITPTISVPTNCTTTAAQENPQVLQNSVSHQVPQNIPQSNSEVTRLSPSAITNTIEESTEVNPVPSVPSLTYPNPANTPMLSGLDIRPVPSISTSPKPNNLKTADVYKNGSKLTGNSSNTFHDTQNNYNLSNQLDQHKSTSRFPHFRHSDRVTKSAPLPFIADENLKASRALMVSAVQHSISATPNKNGMVNVEKTFWPEPLLTTNSNIPEQFSNISQPVRASYSTAVNVSSNNSNEHSSNISQLFRPSYSTAAIASSKDSSVTTTSNYTKPVPFHKRINARRSSLPTVTPRPRPAHPPSYSVAISNKNNYALNPFISPTNVRSPIPQPLQHSVENTRYSPNHLSNNNYYKPNGVHDYTTNNLSSSMSTLSASFTKDSATSCAASTFGHIRVKNMQELT